MADEGRDTRSTAWLASVLDYGRFLAPVRAIEESGLTVVRLPRRHGTVR